MRRMLPILIVAALLTQTTPAAPTGAANPQAETTYWGQALPLGNGTVRTYLTAGSDATGAPAPTAFGVEFSRGALDNLPTAESDGKYCAPDGGLCLEGHEWVLPFPTGGLALPFAWMTLNWNPHGHQPPGIYDVPHFDFHYYLTPEAQRWEIAMGFCEPPAPAPPAPVDCATLQRATMPVPRAIAPPGYINVGATVPFMGNHLISPRAPEFNRVPFTHTFIYGIFDGEVTYLEPMLTRAFIMGQIAPFCAAIAQPPAFGKDGWYPTEYCVRYDPASGSRSVSLQGFKLHNDRARLVADVYRQQLCRDADGPGLRAWVESGLSLPQVINGVAATEEAMRATAVRALYQQLLGRDPVPGDCPGLRSWVGGGLELSEVRDRIMESQEYRARAPGA